MRDPNRRTLLADLGLGAAALGLAGLAPTPAGAAEPAGNPAGVPAPAPSGPKIFLDYDQAALDSAYTQAAYAPNAEKVQKRWISNSLDVLARLAPPQRIAYGDKPIEQMDLYRTDKPNAPIFFFVHGGAWRATIAKDYAFLAEMVLGAGAHYVVPDFDWVQTVGGDLTVLVGQVRRALLKTASLAQSVGGDPARIYVGGQSSGGHLAAVLLAMGQPAAGVGIKGGLCISGIYDLKPVRLSVRGSYVRFDDEMVEDLSPERHIDRLAAPLIVCYGTDETPEFQRQNRSFAAAVTAAGKKAELVVGQNYNHFELLETLASPYGVVGRAFLRLLGQG